MRPGRLCPPLRRQTVSSDSATCSTAAGRAITTIAPGNCWACNQFGPIVNVDRAAPPYGNTRRLITDADVKDDARRAHSSVVPGGAAVKDASGKFIHEDVWRYLFTHPVEQVGQPVPSDPVCRKDLRPKATQPARADK